VKLRGVLPVILCVLGCASQERPPTQVVRSSRALTVVPRTETPRTRRFKETILFPRDGVLPTLDRRENPLIFELPGAVDARMPSSPIELALTPSSAQLLLGDEASIDVALTDDGAPIADASLEVALVSPRDHVRRSLPPTPVGPIDLSHVFHDDDPIGAWTIEVRAKGTSRGISFDRFGSVAMHVGRRTARIVEVAAPRTLDDGAIETDVRLDVGAHDRLEVTALLKTTSGAAVALANTTATFEAGTSTATLRFDPEALALPGPYVVTRVLVYSIASHTTVATSGGDG